MGKVYLKNNGVRKGIYKPITKGTPVTLHKRLGRKEKVK